MNKVRAIALGASVICGGLASAACGTTSGDPASDTPGTTAAPTTTAPASVVPGSSLAQFESSTKAQLGQAQPKGFAVAGVASVQCALPDAWTPGKQFNCYVYNANGTQIGVLTDTILSTQPNYAYNVNQAWEPSGSGNS